MHPSLFRHLVSVIALSIGLLFLCTEASSADPQKREKELLDKLNSKPHTAEEITILYYNLANVYIGYNDTEARRYTQMLFDRSGLLDEQYGNMLLGNITFHVAQYDSAELLLNRALKGYEANYLHDDQMGADIYNSLGHLYNIRSKPEKSIDYYLKALKLCEKSMDYSRMCAICTNISYLYGNVGAESKVKLEYAFKALSYAEKSDDLWTMEQACSMLGNTYLDAGDYEKALEYQLKGLQMSQQLKSEQKECFAALNVGCTYLYMEKYPEAEKYYKTALELAQKNSLKRPESYILSCLSDVYRETKQFELSKQYINMALEQKSVLSKSEQLDLYITAIHLYVAQGDIDNFNQMFDFYLAEKDTIHQLAVHEKMVELEAIYETEKKQSRIVELERRKKQQYWWGGAAILVFGLVIIVLFYRHRLVVNQKVLSDQKLDQMKQEQQLVATQAALDGETAERTRLARDLHDGLGGMLSVVQLTLKGVKTGGYIDLENVNRFDKAIVMLDDSIKELRRVAHNMMPESLLRYGLKVSLTDFCNEVPAVSFHYYGNEKRIDSNLEILVYRSAHELINNALRHAEANTINLQVIQEEDRISLTVQDDGKGFEAGATPKGMGLESINNRVTSFNGKMSIYTSPGKGTEINIEFQLSS